MKQHTIRLINGTDLKEAIEKIAVEQGIEAGVILSLVGSLSVCKLRMAGAKEFREWKEELEIVSGMGTVSKNGSHIHIAVSDISAATFGGHLVSGCTVRTTVECVIGIFEDAVYTREPDVVTGFKELTIKKK